jgi:hypothetical protein
MKFDGTRGMHEHILEMTNLAGKLKALGMNVDEFFLVQFILNSVPPQYGPFQIHYNTIKDKWNVNELASMLVQEEARLKQQGHHSVHLVSHGAKKKWKKPKKGKMIEPSKVNGPPQAIEVHEKGLNNIKCHFCRKFGHVQKDCHKRKAWFEKKGKHLACVCFESNLTVVPSNTWWIDSDSTVHVSYSMQGFLTIQTLNPNENFIVMGNGVKVQVVAIGTFRLFQTLYVPSISRNLVSLSKLDLDGYYFTFRNKKFNLFKNTFFIGSGNLCDGLYKLNLNSHFAKSLLTLHHNVGTNHNLINENSSILWHRRLGHISKERLERLVKDEILPNLDFTDFDVCADCIKGKQTKYTKKCATRSGRLLEIVHTDICGPFDSPSFGREKYFITFIDGFSRYCYIYLLHEKSQTVDALEVYITDVERQLDRKVKFVRSDRGGEYYGRYDGLGQCPGPFAKLLEKHGMCAQYTMPGTPRQNGVVERRIRTLMDMVRSMLSNSSLPISL